MNLIPLIEQFNDFASQVPGLSSYIEKSISSQDMGTIIGAYRDDLAKNGQLTPQLDLMLKILLEKWSFIQEHAPNGISAVNPHYIIDDGEIIKQFVQEMHENGKGVQFEKAQFQPYKSKTIKIANQMVDYSSIYEKYLDCDHPYVCAQLACAFLNAKCFDIGLVFLQKALTHVFAYPNIYWHNHLAITGCVDALYEFQYRLGPIGMNKLSKIFNGGRYFILRCLYLLLSRAIYMSDSSNLDPTGERVSANVISKINYLSLRADLVLHYKNDFAAIFGLGVNPDIQFISDKALAHSVAEEHGLGIITEDAYWDSMKMYRHASLVPNDTGGYADIEDATWGELVDRGRIRSEQLANSLYKDYSEGKFVITHSDLSNAIGFLHEYLVDSTLNYDTFLQRRDEAYIAAWKSYKEELTQSSTHLILRKEFEKPKSCAEAIEAYLKDNQVEYLYHFTDRRNLASIIENRGLYSWKYCEENKINIPFPGGDDLSRQLDTRYDLGDFVRLSFCSDHPMVYRLKASGRDMILLKIKVNAAWSNDTLFSDMNATAKLHHHGAEYNDLLRVDMNAVKKRYVSRDDPDFAKHQAEVLVKTFVPIEYIVNLDNPISL